MTIKLDKQDLNLLFTSWPKIRKATMKILKTTVDLDPKSCVPMNFDPDLILGHGKWGIVLGLPAVEEIVVKITTDPFEWFLIEMIQQDDELKSHPAVPHVLGTAVLDIFQDDLPCYLIIRENLKIGVPLTRTSPLLKMKKLLLHEFIDPMEKIEQELAEIMRHQGNLNLLHISTTYNIMAGEIKKHVAKIKTKIPKVNSDSKFYWLLDLLKKLLDRGIALVDIHVNNLGQREFDIAESFEGFESRDLDCVVLSDLGMAYGTPIFLKSGMLYNNLEDMMQHFVKILKDYSDIKKSSAFSRPNPAVYDYDFVVEEIKSCCESANHQVSNVLVDPNCYQEISRIAGKILVMVPQMHLSGEIIKTTIQNEMITVIQEWIEKDIIFDESVNTDLILKCYVDVIDKGMAKCCIVEELSFEDEAPIGEFHIPKRHQLYQTIKKCFEAFSLKRASSSRKKEFIQHIPESFLVKLNGVPYEKIYSN